MNAVACDVVIIAGIWVLILSNALQAILKAVEACPWPLYISVLMKDAVRWQSSLDVTKLVLPSCVELAVSELLDSVEQHLGVVFVSHTLAFIAAVDSGLSEVPSSRC